MDWPGCSFDDVVDSKDHLSGFRCAQQHLTLHLEGLCDAQVCHVAHCAFRHVCRGKKTHTQKSSFVQIMGCKIKMGDIRATPSTLADETWVKLKIQCTSPILTPFLLLRPKELLSFNLLNQNYGENFRRSRRLLALTDKTSLCLMRIFTSRQLRFVWSLTQAKGGLVLLVCSSQLSHKVSTVIAGVVGDDSWQLEQKTEWRLLFLPERCRTNLWKRILWGSHGKILTFFAFFFFPPLETQVFPEFWRKILSKSKLHF